MWINKNCAIYPGRFWNKIFDKKNLINYRYRNVKDNYVIMFLFYSKKYKDVNLAVESNYILEIRFNFKKCIYKLIFDHPDI